MQQKVIQIGHSVGVVIPQALRREMNLKPGDKVVVQKEVGGQGLLVVKEGKNIKSTSITPEFLDWLGKFNKKYSRALKELASK